MTEKNRVRPYTSCQEAQEARKSAASLQGQRSHGAELGALRLIAQASSDHAADRMAANLIRQTPAALIGGAALAWPPWWPILGRQGTNSALITINQ